MIICKRFLRNRVFTCYLTVAFLVLSFASSAPAMFIPSPHGGNVTGQREADLQRIQKLLESSIIRDKLSQFGLTPKEIEDRLQQLDEEQVHQIVSQIDELETGGDAEWIIIIVLLALLTFFILELTGVIDVLKW